MDDAIKVLTAKFSLSNDSLNKVADGSDELSAWLNVLGAYILDNDKKQEEQRENEASLRKQRLNAEHQLTLLEKQLIACNVSVGKHEKTIAQLREGNTQKEEHTAELEKKWKAAVEENRKITEEIDKMKQNQSHLETERVDFSTMLDEKHKEIERLNEEWQDASKKLADANKARYEMKYQLDEIKNSDVRREFKEKRMEQEKSALQQMLDKANDELKEKTNVLSNLQKDKMSSVRLVQDKLDQLQQKHKHVESQLNIYKKKCDAQGTKIEGMVAKMKSTSEEHTQAENTMQQELTAQTKLVQLYKDDRDHAKEKLEEVTSAVSELQAMVKAVGEEKTKLEALLNAEKEVSFKKITELESKVKSLTAELDNANDLLKVARPGTKVVSEAELSNLYPLAAATSAVLKKGMSLTQIYTEYVKSSDELILEKQENERLKLYMEQILQEVEEKAPLLLQQKEDYEHAKKTVENMALKLDANIKECRNLQNVCAENERKVEFQKREEKRLHSLCVDLSQQVRVLLKEVEEARGRVVSCDDSLPELLTATPGEQNSSSGQVISEHLVTFKSLEELQAQNQRLLLTVRELSEEQEKLEQEGGPEIIQELKRRIEAAESEVDSMKENKQTQDSMMHQLSRQRDTYKVLCEQGGVMLGSEVSSATLSGSKSITDLQLELSKVTAEMDATTAEQNKLRETFASSERTLNDTINKKNDEISSLKLENDRLLNKIENSDERYSILQSTSESYKKEAAALEEKCKTITEALNKARVEAETYKQDCSEAKEKHVTAEVSVKSLKVEKDLIKEANTRIMQENESLLNQQRSQSVLLSNLQTIQNNLERKEFDTRTSFTKQVDTLQREVKALRRQQEAETHQLKSAAATAENDIKEVQIQLGVEKEKNKQLKEELLSTKQSCETLETKNKELELTSKATEERLTNVMEREASGKAKEDYQREMENYKTKVRELELTIGNVSSEKKGLEEQVEVTKKNLEQFQEICNSNETALNTLTKLKEEQAKEYENRLKTASQTIERLQRDIKQNTSQVAALKKSNEDVQRNNNNTVTDLRNQIAPLERRLQEVTKALVQAKENESEAVKQAQLQVKIGKEAQEKYEKEIVLHGKDVELLTQLKDELKEAKEKYGGIEEREAEVQRKLDKSEELLEQMKEHNSAEIKKGEAVRQDLIGQNTILHQQVEKLSAQLATAKSQPVRSEETGSASAPGESYSNKSVAEVYELLRFVRREKEIAETKAEASETESMRYRQRCECLQREAEETKVALELELQRTKGRMLTETEHQDLMEKVQKVKQYEEMNQNMKMEAQEMEKKLKTLVDKNKKLEVEMKPLVMGKKSLEGEKSSWLAEKTALKQEIERWTTRTNQLMAQGSKSESEEVKKLQATKMHSEKAIAGLQDELRRTKQQLDSLNKKSLKLKTDNNELQSKNSSLQTELKSVTSGPKKDVGVADAVMKEKDREIDEWKAKHAEAADKIKMIPQLKRLAKKYKTSSDKFSQVLTEHNIPIPDVAGGATPATPSTPGSAVKTSMETQTPPINLQGAVQQVTPIKPLTDDEKVKLIQANERLDESVKTTSLAMKELDETRALYETEKNRASLLEGKLEETQKSYIESEKKVLELKKSVEALQADCSDKEKKEEKTRKLLKTVKEKMTVTTKNNAASSREVANLKSQVEDLQNSLEQANEQANTFNAIRVQLDVKVINLEKQVESLLSEKRALMERLEEVQRELESVSEQKKAADKFIKAASQKQSSRIQAVTPGANKTASLGDAPSGYDMSSITPLTATVRPSATPASQQSPSSKFHQQLSRTASIRPLAHATAPTAMISPTVPMTQAGAGSSGPSNLVASVSALPSTSFSGHVVEVQGRNVNNRVGGMMTGAGRSNRARVPVQAQGPVQEDTADAVYAVVEEEPILDQQVAGPSSSTSGGHTIEQNQRPTFGKRSHVEVVEEADEDMALLDDVQGESSSSTVHKRQRVDNIDDNQDDFADSQEGQLEEDLLAEDVEEGDDDVMVDMPTSQHYGGDDVAPSQGASSSSGSREAQLQMERQLQPSPQELLRQSRLQGRVRNQLPSFSLMSGQGNSGFYEETDDSTVPSTPTLFMPKRTDGFAEAVSSPVVRFPAFSFSSNEQTQAQPQSSALELPGMHLHQETRVDLMTSEEQSNVPHTPLSVVPSVSESQVSSSQDPMTSQRGRGEDRRVTFEQKFFPEDNSQQEQNVPQQIDLTEDDDDEDLNDDGQEIQGDEEVDEAIDMATNNDDLVDLDYDEDGSDVDDIDDSVDSDSGDDEDDGSVVVDSDVIDTRPSHEDAVEILVDDEEDLLTTEEEKEKRGGLGTSSALQTDTMGDEKSSPMFSSHAVSDELGAHAHHPVAMPTVTTSTTPISTLTTTEQPSSSRIDSDLKDDQTTQDDEKETERAKPVRITRTTRGAAGGAGVRPRIRRSAAGRGKQSPGKPR